MITRQRHDALTVRVYEAAVMLCSGASHGASAPTSRGKGVT